MLRPTYLPALLILGLVFFPASARADNEGLADLDQATETKLTASTFRDLSTVVQKLESALEKGLDEENTKFANQLLTATLFQRASILSGAIFNDAGQDPRWAQLRLAALGDLERSLKLDNNQPEAHYLLARLHSLPRGNRERAIKALDEVVKQSPDTPVLVKALVLRSDLQTEDDKRLADLDKAIELAPQDAEAHRARGLFYLFKEDFDKSLADLNLALEFEADHAPTYEAQGLALMMKDRLDDALAAFNKAIELEPNLPTPYTHRARVHALKQDNDAALKDVNRALEIEPRALQALLLRAQIHEQKGDTKKALSDVEEALVLRPGNVPALRMQAELLASSGKLERAITILENLAQLQPDQQELVLQLGIYYMADKQPRRAIKLFDAILEDDNDNWRALRNRGDARLSIADQAGAIADYRAALKLQPENSGLLNNLAWVLATSTEDSLRQGKEAIELATKACELTEYEQAHILSTLAAAFAETGDWNSAKNWAAKAVELGDSTPQKEQLAQELKSYEKEKPWREAQNVEEKSDEPAEQTSPGQTSEF